MEQHTINQWVASKFLYYLLEDTTNRGVPRLERMCLRILITNTLEEVFDCEDCRFVPRAVTMKDMETQTLSSLTSWTSHATQTETEKDDTFSSPPQVCTKCIRLPQPDHPHESTDQAGPSENQGSSCSVGSVGSAKDQFEMKCYDGSTSSISKHENITASSSKVYDLSHLSPESRRVFSHYMQAPPSPPHNPTIQQKTPVSAGLAQPSQAKRHEMSTASSSKGYDLSHLSPESRKVFSTYLEAPQSTPLRKCKDKLKGKRLKFNKKKKANKGSISGQNPLQKYLKKTTPQ